MKADNRRHIQDHRDKIRVGVPSLYYHHLICCASQDLADMQADKQELWQKLAERDADAAVAEDRSLVRIHNMCVAPPNLNLGTLQDWNEAYRDSLAEWREEPHESHWDKYWRFRYSL